MSKVRFSISVDETQAVRIKTAAALASQDVSSYMSKAALAAAERDELAAGAFADIDQRIAANEKPTEGLPWPPPAADGQLSKAEQARVTEKWNRLLAITRRDAA